MFLFTCLWTFTGVRMLLCRNRTFTLHRSAPNFNASNTSLWGEAGRTISAHVFVAGFDFASTYNNNNRNNNTDIKININNNNNNDNMNEL